jgi:hypothetical protein
MVTYSGGCQCGAIRFSTIELIDNAHICHCRMCQKAVGNYFAALVSAPKDKLKWTRGKAARFKSSGDVGVDSALNAAHRFSLIPFTPPTLVCALEL